MKKSFTNVDKEAFAKPSTQSYNYIKVESLIPARLIYTGAVTGNRYEFPTAGTVLAVDERDVPDLLVKVMGNTSCCGGGQNAGNQVFQIHVETKG